MKKIFPAILLAGALLGGCSLLDKIPAESIRIEGQEYRTGFYENLYPANLSFTGKEYEVEGILYHQVESENFNMVQCDLGTVTTGRDSILRGRPVGGSEGLLCRRRKL